MDNRLAWLCSRLPGCGSSASGTIQAMHHTTMEHWRERRCKARPDMRISSAHQSHQTRSQCPSLAPHTSAAAAITVAHSMFPASQVSLRLDSLAPEYLGTTWPFCAVARVMPLAGGVGVPPWSAESPGGPRTKRLDLLERLGTVGSGQYGRKGKAAPQIKCWPQHRQKRRKPDIRTYSS